MEDNTQQTEQVTTDPIDKAIDEVVNETINGPAEESDTDVESAADETTSAPAETESAEETKTIDSDSPETKSSEQSISHENVSTESDAFDDAGEPVDEIAETIKAMDEEGGYDPKLMKLLGCLIAENQKLKSAGASAEKQTFFDRQFGSLDEGVRSHVDAAHKSQLKSKFDTLLAGYKATNAKVSREDVFQEAAKLALGDLMQKAAEDRKTSALNERKRLALARPGGESGQRRGKGPVTEEDIASEIWDQINR